MQVINRMRSGLSSLYTFVKQLLNNYLCDLSVKSQEELVGFVAIGP